MRLCVIYAIVVFTKKRLKKWLFKVYRGMNRYEKGQIYKIVDVGYNKCYIGSTCEALSRRFERHTSRYKRNVGDTRAVLLFDEFGVENCRIERIEKLPCNSKEELLQREGYYIQNTECVNRCIAGRTAKAYYEQNKEDIKAKSRQHYHDNRDARRAQQKKYWDKNADALNAHKKQYRQENIEVFAEREKIKYERHKQQILEKCKQKYLCECGSYYTYSHKSRHLKTKKHQEYIQQQAEQNNTNI